jgi:hypothetical protein
VSSSQTSSQNTTSDITPAASTGSQTRTISQWTPGQREQLFRAELAGKELDNRLKDAQLRRLEVGATVGLSPATVNPAHVPGLSPALSQSQEIGKNDPPEVTIVSQLHPGELSSRTARRSSTCTSNCRTISTSKSLHVRALPSGIGKALGHRAAATIATSRVSKSYTLYDLGPIIHPSPNR